MNTINIFGKKVKVVTNSDCSCDGCALKDICSNIYGLDIYPCNTSDGVSQKFIKVD